jgi:hypothetical protein
MSTGAEASRQFAHTGEGDASGGNLSGHNPKPWNPMMVPDFQGKSGQPNNQDTSRPKGST